MLIFFNIKVGVRSPRRPSHDPPPIDGNIILYTYIYALGGSQLFMSAILTSKIQRFTTLWYEMMKNISNECLKRRPTINHYSCHTRIPSENVEIRMNMRRAY